MRFLLQTYENPHIRTSLMWPLLEEKPGNSFKIMFHVVGPEPWERLSLGFDK